MGGLTILETTPMSRRRRSPQCTPDIMGLTMAVLALALLAAALTGATGCAGLGSAEEEDAWKAYWDASMGVRRDYVATYNKIVKQSEKKSAGKQRDTIADALERAAKAQAAIEPPERLAAAHAALVESLEKETRALRKHARRVMALLAAMRRIGAFDFTAQAATMNRMEKAIDACDRAVRRADTAWDRWLDAAVDEGGRLGFTITVKGF